MIDAGLPLVQCLELLAKEEPDKRLAAAIDKSRRTSRPARRSPMPCRSGRTPSTRCTRNMVAAGEAGGILDTILKRLSTFIEKQAKLKSQVRSAMIYPIAVLSIAAIVVVSHSLEGHSDVHGAVRRTERHAAAADADRHLAEQEARSSCMPFLVVGGFAGAYLFRRYYRTPRRAGCGSIATLLKMPLIGKIFRKVAVARFCRTLSTLLSSGVPILDGLDITAKTSGNAVIEQAIKQVRARIERGETIAAPLARRPACSRRWWPR